VTDFNQVRWGGDKKGIPRPSAASFAVGQRPKAKGQKAKAKIKRQKKAEGQMATFKQRSTSMWYIFEKICLTKKNLAKSPPLSPPLVHVVWHAKRNPINYQSIKTKRPLLFVNFWNTLLSGLYISLGTCISAVSLGHSRPFQFT
jgi:hypothetical protein